MYYWYELKKIFNKSGAREGVYFAVDIVVVIFLYRGILIAIIKAQAYNCDASTFVFE